MLSIGTHEHGYFCCFQMFLAASWTDLVVHMVCSVKEAIEINERKDIKVLNWQGEKNITKWDL